MVVLVKVSNMQAFSNIERIADNFPLAVGKAGNEFGLTLQRRLRRNITVKKLIDTGELHSGTKWVRKSKIGGELRMPVHGIMLDSMRPHWVEFKPSRTGFIGWAQRKGNLDVKTAAASQGYIFVRPHPFIRGPMERTIRDLPDIIKKHTDKNSKSRGKRQ